MNNNRHFWKLWSSSALSNLGDGVLIVAFPLLAASITHDPRSVAGVAFALGLPWLIFGLAGGVSSTGSTVA